MSQNHMDHSWQHKCPTSWRLLNSVSCRLQEDKSYMLSELADSYLGMTLQYICQNAINAVDVVPKMS